MKKQYVLLLLLLCGATLGASAQAVWQNPVQLGLETDDGIRQDSVIICYGDDVTFQIEQRQDENSYSYTLQVTNDMAVNFGNVEDVETTSEKTILLNGMLTDGTYYYRVAWSSGTGSSRPQFSDTLTVVVLPQFVVGDITSDMRSSICYGAVGGTLTVNGVSGGMEDSTTYTWSRKQSEDSALEPLEGAGASLLVDTLQHTWIYTVSVSNTCADTPIERSYTINVYNQIVPGTISIGGDTSVNICSGSAPGVLSVDENHPFTGGLPNFSYLWQDSTSSHDWQDIAGSVETSLQPTGLTSDHWYRMVATNECDSDPIYSNTVHVHVWAPIDTTDFAVSPVDTVICYNTSVSLSATLATAETGNTLTHVWQRKGDGENDEWNDINAAFASTFTTDNLTDTTYFRVKAYTNCDTKYTDSVRIAVLPPFSPGHITSDTTSVCNGYSNLRIYFDTFPTGCMNAIPSYSWRSKASDPWGGWSDGDTSYRTSILTTDMVYQAQVIDFCASDTTNVITISVAPIINPGTIADQTQNVVCAGAQPDALTLASSFSGGMGDFSYRWESSTDGGTTWDSVANTNSYQPGPLTDSTWYRVVGTNSCGSETTQPQLIKVYGVLSQPSFATNDTTLCFGTRPDTLRLADEATGSNGQFAYHWLQSADGTAWDTISDADTATYQPGHLTSTTSFRLMVTSTVRGCNPVYSIDTVHIAVLPQMQPGRIVAADSNLCHGLSTILALDTANLPSGADSTFTFRWQSSTDGTIFSDLIDTLSGDTLFFSDSFYTTPGLDDPVFYRVMVYNELCQLQLPTDTAYVHVYAPFEASDIHVEYTADGSVAVGTCYGTIPEGFYFAANEAATGGAGAYTYRWHSSANETLSTNSAQYVPGDTLFATISVSLTTTDSLCGTYTSNTIPVEVWSLPDVPTLGGDTAYLCNSTAPLRYWVAPDSNLTYRWSSNSASFVDNQTDSSSVYLVWNSGLDTVSLDLTLTDLVHGCVRTVTFDSIPIDTNAVAPDTTDILIKFGGNILVCNDATPNAHYQWGYTDRASGQDVPYEGSNSRYYQTPDVIDTANRDYFVIVWYGTEHCKTRSYYVPRPTASSNPTDELHLTVAPNPSMGEVYYKLDSNIPGAYTVEVYDAVGQLLLSLEGNDYKQDNPLPIGRKLNQGIYVVSVATANSVVSQKIIVK